MKASFVLKDNSVPRTHFYQQFLSSVVRNPRFSAGPLDHDTVILPAEECSPCLNWPRFDNFASAFVRGTFCDADMAKYFPYMSRFLGLDGLKCVFDQMPGANLATKLKHRSDIIVCDINLLWERRAENERSISLPVMPIITGEKFVTDQKDIFASFRGYRSHPLRDLLRTMHNGRDVVCEVLEQRPYAARIDHSIQQYDEDYVDLLRRSLFAFVPRGDASFSIRLLEVMSFGCIPVVLSDDWVLPFDRSVDWTETCLQFPESGTPWIVHRLRRIPDNRIRSMQAAVEYVYKRKFSSIDRMVDALFREIELLLDK